MRILPISSFRQSLNKIFFLLDANSELLAEVGDFIKQSTEYKQTKHRKHRKLQYRIHEINPIN
jgi:hypothetical protein